METTNEVMPTIPQWQTKEEVSAREQIIKKFYASWNAVHPEKRVYNANLQAFIYVRFLSIQETAEKAARVYKSTLAVLYLTEILELAKVVKVDKPKPNQKQSRFAEMIVMQYNKVRFGRIKLTVGVLRGSGEKIQYCITAIDK